MPAAIKFTQKDIEAAQTMYAFGVPQEQIARILKCSHEVLVARLGKLMEDYKVKANARVASTLYQMAISGEQPAATFFWLKTRAGWRETDRLEIEHKQVNLNIEAKLANVPALAQAVRILTEANALGDTAVPPLRVEALDSPAAQSQNGHTPA